MTPPADRFGRLRILAATPPQDDLESIDVHTALVMRWELARLLAALDAAEARNIELEHECQDLEERLNAAEELATAVETHRDARIAAHALVPGRSDKEWFQLKQIELNAWWRTTIAARDFREVMEK